jgi:uncharacterized membrane protein YebE (DUF533 family)
VLKAEFSRNNSLPLINWEIRNTLTTIRVYAADVYRYSLSGAATLSCRNKRGKYIMKMTIALVIASVSIPVLAGTPVINQRQENQQGRIAQGVASGQLTGKETARLEQGQARVDNMKANAKADGKVTKGERAEIRHAQNVQSQKIYNKKHN